jgi:hypothetical protein
MSFVLFVTLFLFFSLLLFFRLSITTYQGVQTMHNVRLSGSANKNLLTGLVQPSYKNPTNQRINHTLLAFTVKVLLFASFSSCVDRF